MVRHIIFSGVFLFAVDSFALDDSTHSDSEVVRQSFTNRHGVTRYPSTTELLAQEKLREREAERRVQEEAERKKREEQTRAARQAPGSPQGFFEEGFVTEKSF